MSDDTQLYNELADARVRLNKMELRYRGLIFMAGYLVKTFDEAMEGIHEKVLKSVQSEFKDIDEAKAIQISKDALKRLKKVCRDITDLRISLVAEYHDPILEGLGDKKAIDSSKLMSDQDREDLTQWLKDCMASQDHFDAEAQMDWYREHTSAALSFVMTILSDANDHDKEKLARLMMGDLIGMVGKTKDSGPGSVH